MSGKKQICRACGAKLKDGAQRCEACGAYVGSYATGSRPYMSEQELSAKLVALNGKRKMFKALMIVSCCLMGISITVLPFVVGAGIGFSFLALPVGLMIVFIVLGSNVKKEMKGLISANFTKSLLAEAFELETYEPGTHIDQRIISTTELVPGWNRCYGSDFVIGKYRGVKFMFSDIHLTNYTSGGSDDSDTESTIFKGQWIACAPGRRIASPLILRDRPKGMIKNLFRDTTSNMETENPAFNEKFQILTGNPASARDILTPQLMEFLMSAYRVADVRIFMYFGYDWVHIAIHNKRDSFEIGKGKDLNDITSLRARLSAEVRYIADIMDALLQNTWLFGGEDNS